MADEIQLKRSSEAGVIPLASELLPGELAINIADRTLYAKDVAGNVFVISPAALSDYENDLGFVTAAEVSAAAPIQSVVGAEAVTVVIANGVATVSAPPQQQADWAEDGPLATTFIKNKPIALSQFENDEEFVDAAGAAAVAPVQNITGAGVVSVSSEAGVFTIDVAERAQSDWSDSDLGSPSHILNKPTKLSQFENDEGYVDAAGAASAAPVQSIASPDGSISIEQTGGEYLVTLPAQAAVQSNWSQTDTSAADFIQNKPTALSDFANDEGFVDAAAAATAAPVQSIVAGDNVSVTAVDGEYTIAASVDSGVMSVDADEPITIGGTASVPVIGVAEASAESLGVVRFASQQDVSSGEPLRAIDAAQLKAAVPTKLSALTNDTGFITQSSVTQAVSGYLPLSGGTVTGTLIVAPGGNALAPTPPVGDSSNAVATTEWVQRELIDADDVAGLWQLGGSDVSSDPTSGFLRVSQDGAFLAISKYAVSGIAPTVASLRPGTLVVISASPTELTTELGIVIQSHDGVSITTE
jgi:hypothetical protein